MKQLTYKINLVLLLLLLSLVVPSICTEHNVRLVVVSNEKTESNKYERLINSAEINGITVHNKHLHSSDDNLVLLYKQINQNWNDNDIIVLTNSEDYRIISDAFTIATQIALLCIVKESMAVMSFPIDLRTTSSIFDFLNPDHHVTSPFDNNINKTLDEINEYTERPGGPPVAFSPEQLIILKNLINKVKNENVKREQFLRKEMMKTKPKSTCVFAGTLKGIKKVLKRVIEPSKMIKEIINNENTIENSITTLKDLCVVSPSIRYLSGIAVDFSGEVFSYIPSNGKKYDSSTVTGGIAHESPPK